MSDMRNIEILLDYIRLELSGIRKILEQEANSKSMILQKVNNENYQTKLY